MAEDDQFKLYEEDPIGEYYHDGRPVKPPAAGNGRPKGSPNKKSDPIWKLAREMTPAIMQKICSRAVEMKDEIDFRCAQLVLSRTWPKPRSAPVQIDISQQVDARTLLLAMANGELTPADASSLLGAMNKHMLNGHHAVNGSGIDAKKLLREKLERAIMARRGQNAKTHSESIDETSR